MTKREWPAWALMAAVLFVLYLIVMAYPIHAQEQSDSDWISNLRNPVNGMRCCDEADGETVQTELGPNGYRVFVAGQWIDVPPTAVLHEPNRHGRPIVWWYRSVDYQTRAISIKIRCFLPGALF